MELQQAIEKILAAAPHRIVFSAPAKGGRYRRATLLPTPNGWQAQRLTDKQAFHENISAEGLAAAILELLSDFSQLHSFGKGGGFALRISKKGKPLLTKTPPEAPNAKNTANRQKQGILPEDVAIPPLVDMGIFTQDGRPVASRRDKLRQINRFVELVEHGLPKTLPPTLRIVDFGCGKSYLTFILYYYLTAIRGVNAEIVGLDLKADVVAACNAAAKKYGYTGLHFAVGDIAEYTAKGPVDMVVTLHACDTATDYALASAVAWGASYIFSVPCCQHEANAQIQTGDLALLTRYGIVKERVSALMTDAVRANLLEACGYKTQLVEFVELEHTPKNIMIRAAKAPGDGKTARAQKALREVQSLCAAFSLRPTLLGLLQKQGKIE